MRDGQKRDLARRLRTDMTDCERHLWRDLRSRRFEGHKFRRQVPVGPFIADFACVQSRLIIELDGGQHSGNERDQSRDAFLEREGWRVLRFWNNEVLQNREGVLNVIAEALLQNTPSPGRR
jgi:very-short-patch-repair endonuclease